MSDFLWPQGLQPARLLCPWGFLKQEYWSGLLCPPPGGGGLPNPGIEPRSPILQVDSLRTEPPGKPKNLSLVNFFFFFFFKQHSISLHSQNWIRSFLSLCILLWDPYNMNAGAFNIAPKVSGCFGAYKILFVPSKSGLFPILWKSCNQTPLAYKVRFPGDSQFLCQLPRLRSLMVRLRTFTTVRELLWYYCSPVHGWPTEQVWDLILSCLGPSYHLIVASSLSLDVGYLFLVGSSVLLSMVIQQLVTILVLLQEMSACPSTLPYWTIEKAHSLLFKITLLIVDFESCVCVMIVFWLCFKRGIFLKNE